MPLRQRRDATLTSIVRPLAPVVVLCCAAAILAAQDRPLPERDAFLAETRKHLQSDSTLQSSYAYVETRRELKLSGDGGTTNERVRVFESYPGLPGEGRWERLISENGVPVPAETLAKQDRERQTRAEELVRQQTTRPAASREEQEREWQKRRREVEDIIDDIFTVFDIQMVGREAIEGHDTIAFSLTPRRDAKPKTRQGGQMRSFKIRAWVSEADHELVRLDGEAIQPVSFGFGVLARLHPGAELSFLRRKVNDEVWLPAKTTYKGSARVGLVVTLRRSGSSEYSSYKKFSVDTSTIYKTSQ